MFQHNKVKIEVMLIFVDKVQEVYFEVSEFEGANLLELSEIQISFRSVRTNVAALCL